MLVEDLVVWDMERLKASLIVYTLVGTIRSIILDFQMTSVLSLGNCENLFDDDSKTAKLVSYSYMLTCYSDRQKLAYVLLDWGLSVQETRCLMGIHKEA